MIKILYAEDDKLFINIVKIMLSNTFEVDIANTGTEAVSKVVNNHNYDLIIMDIILPVMNGILAAKNIKSIYPNLPIIALTIRDIDDIKKDKNFNLVISKNNINKESLRCKIYEILLIN
jgi:CheY-like chemotaxis protein